MATDVNIPGDELEEAQRLLVSVRDTLDVPERTPDFDAALGADMAPSAPTRFEADWTDGRVQLRREIEGLEGALAEVLDAFATTDQDAVDSIQVDQAAGA